MNLPSISIVTPSFNQGQYLEKTIESVLNQNYSNLEYLVLDGGSTDGTRAVLEKFSSQLSYWRSQPDDGQFAAIDEGFRRSSGEIMAWINSDDMYLPWTFQVVAQAFSDFPEIEWITSNFPLFWDSRGSAVYCSKRNGFNKRTFQRGGYLPTTGGCIQQESTFWRRSLWARAGAKMQTDLKLAGDFELWSRFFKAGARLHAVATPLAGFRFHAGQKTATLLKEYEREAAGILGSEGSWLGGYRFIHRWVKPGIATVWNRSRPYSPKLSLNFTQRLEEKFWHIRR